MKSDVLKCIDAAKISAKAKEVVKHTIGELAAEAIAAGVNPMIAWAQASDQALLNLIGNLAIQKDKTALKAIKSVEWNKTMAERAEKAEEVGNSL